MLTYRDLELPCSTTVIHIEVSGGVRGAALISALAVILYCATVPSPTRQGSKLKVNIFEHEYYRMVRLLTKASVSRDSGADSRCVGPLANG